MTDSYSQEPTAQNTFLGTLAAPFVWAGRGVYNVASATVGTINSVADGIGGVADSTQIAPTTAGGRRRRGKKGVTLKKRRGGRKTRTVRRH
jgi:hypothetical protein